MILLTPRFVAESRAEGGDARLRRGRGGLGHGRARAAGLRAGQHRHRPAGRSGETIGLLAVSAALLVAFVVIEMRAKAPLLPLGIFRLRNLTGANIVGLLLGRGDLLDVLLPVALHAAGAGLLGAADRLRATCWSPSSIIIAAGVVAGPGHALRRQGDPGHRHGAADPGPRSGSRRSTVDGSYVADLVPGFLLTGVGLGFAFVPVSIAALAGRAAARGGHRLGAHQHVAADRRRARHRDPRHHRHHPHRVADARGRAAARRRVPGALTEGFQYAFAVGAGMALIGLIATLVFLDRKDPVPQTGGRRGRGAVGDPLDPRGARAPGVVRPGPRPTAAGQPPRPQDLGDRPGLERAAGGAVRRVAVGGLGHRAEAPLGQVGLEPVEHPVHRLADAQRRVDVRARSATATPCPGGRRASRSAGPPRWRAAVAGVVRRQRPQAERREQVLAAATRAPAPASAPERPVRQRRRRAAGWAAPRRRRRRAVDHVEEAAPSARANRARERRARPRLQRPRRRAGRRRRPRAAAPTRERLDPQRVDLDRLAGPRRDRRRRRCARPSRSAPPRARPGAAGRRRGRRRSRTGCRRRGASMIASSAGASSAPGRRRRSPARGGRGRGRTTASRRRCCTRALPRVGGVGQHPLGQRRRRRAAAAAGPRRPGRSPGTGPRTRSSRRATTRRTTGSRPRRSGRRGRPRTGRRRRRAGGRRRRRAAPRPRPSAPRAAAARHDRRAAAAGRLDRSPAHAVTSSVLARPQLGGEAPAAQRSSRSFSPRAASSRCRTPRYQSPPGASPARRRGRRPRRRSRPPSRSTAGAPAAAALAVDVAPRAQRRPARAAPAGRRARRRCDDADGAAARAPSRPRARRRRRRLPPPARHAVLERERLRVDRGPAGRPSRRPTRGWRAGPGRRRRTSDRVERDEPEHPAPPATAAGDARAGRGSGASRSPPTVPIA